MINLTTEQLLNKALELPTHSQPRMLKAASVTYNPSSLDRLDFYDSERHAALLAFARRNIGNEVYYVSFNPNGLPDTYYGGRTPVRKATVTEVNETDYQILDTVCYKMSANSKYDSYSLASDLIMGTEDDVKLSLAIERELSRRNQIAYINEKYGVLHK